MKYNPKKLGYYQAGELETLFKYQAIQQDKKTNSGVKWLFNESEFTAHDWTREPTESLNELYRQRAQQLRDDYNYLVVFYSGGSDSQTMLDTFINNNIFIDEIVCFHCLKGDKSPYSYFNEEIFKIAVPYLEKVRHTIPNTKINLIDHTDLNLAFDFAKGWEQQTNVFLLPNVASRVRMRELLPHYKNLLERYTAVGFVWGMDKPHVFLDEAQRFYIQYDDVLDGYSGPYSQARAHQGWYDEMFYQDPAWVKIISKQAWSVVNPLLLKSVPEEFLSNAKTKYGQCPDSGRYLMVHGAVHFMYPEFDIDRYIWQYDASLNLSLGTPNSPVINRKPDSPVFGPRDQWFWRRSTHLPQYMNWLNGINRLYYEYYNEDSNKSWLNSDTMFDGIKGSLGTKWYLT
jgi:hypothetical protein